MGLDSYSDFLFQLWANPYIWRYDRVLLLLNLLLLLCIAFLPFPSSVIADYDNQTSNVFYALCLAITGLIAAGMWLYASSGGRLPHKAARQGL